MSMRLEQVSASYSDTTVLRDVSLTVPSGRVVALLGPNGAGKTTLLRVASGLLAPRAGHVSHNGTDLTGASSDSFARAGITLIPEGHGVFPNLTVAENLALFAPPGRARAAVNIATDAFPRLGQRLSQYAGTMSGGEQQMLAMSRAYVRDTNLVLADEVSMGLAPKLVDEIYEALRQLADTGRSLLLVEQFAAKALAMADLVYVMVGGHITYAGEPCELDAASLTEKYFGGHAVVT